VDGLDLLTINAGEMRDPVIVIIKGAFFAALTPKILNNLSHWAL